MTSYSERLQARWQDHLQQALDYYREHATLDGLWSHDADTMRWIQNQRTAERNGRLRQDRLEVLDSNLPGWRDDRRHRVHRYIENVQEWLQRHPGATVNDIRARETLELDGQLIRLGHQTFHYRHRHRAGLLDRQTIDELKAIGWPAPENQ